MPAHDHSADGEQPPVSPFQPGFSPECLACPICLMFFTIKQTRPEVMEHVMKAAFELFQAFRAVVETTSERWDQAQRLQHIPIS